MGVHKWRDIRRPRSSRTARRQARQRAKDLAGGWTLKELRRLTGLTQVTVAKRMKLAQHDVSRLETRTDHVSTLRAYVEALGGRVIVVAEFDEDLPGVDANILRLQDV